MSKKRNQSLVQLFLFIGIIIFLNILGSFFFGKLDLTEEKRFTLTQPTRQLLTDLDDVVYIKVLLDGELPAGIKRLQNSTLEMLDDFRSYSGYIEYEFENPSEGSTSEINARRKELAKDNIYPNNLRVKSADETRELIFYTYAVLNYKGRSLPLNLVDKEGGVLSDNDINTSISLLEYKLANAIQKLKANSKPVVAFTTGHGELSALQTADIRQSLRNYYDLGVFNLDSAYVIPQEVRVLVVARPRSAFNEKHKFLIDQYIMNGGNVIWLIDKLAVNLDSMYRTRDYVPLDYDLNLEDQLFKYGARIQPNLVLDLQCSQIPLVVDQQGTQDMFNWYYHPVITPSSQHPIVKNMDAVNLYFPSKIDTVRTKTPVKKTVLLESSEFTREQFSPVRLNFEILRYKPEPDKFNKKGLPMAVLLEGEFPSLFDGRVSDGMTAMLSQINQPFKGKSEPTKQLVVADGDIIKNLINPDTKEPIPLGLNRYSGYTFANKAFLVNAIEYMLDSRGIIEARAKDVKLRLLNTVKAQAEQSKWQLINILLPLLFLILFGLFYNWNRKRKYAG